eukprot:superscaffoldBa00004904_g19625
MRVQPPPRPHSFPPAEPKYPAAYGDHRTELGCNPAPTLRHSGTSWTQPLPSRLLQGKTSIISEPSYRGPHPRNTKLNSPMPFSDTMVTLNDNDGRPHSIVPRCIAAVMDSLDIRHGEVELQCGSHVGHLLRKLPPEQLTDHSEWLKYESWCQDSEGQLAVKGAREVLVSRPEGWQSKQSITVLHRVKDTVKKCNRYLLQREHEQAISLFCNTEEHYLSKCKAVSRLAPGSADRMDKE